MKTCKVCLPCKKERYQKNVRSTLIYGSAESRKALEEVLFLKKEEKGKGQKKKKVKDKKEQQAAAFFQDK